MSMARISSGASGSSSPSSTRGPFTCRTTGSACAAGPNEHVAASVSSIAARFVRAVDVRRVGRRDMLRRQFEMLTLMLSLAELGSRGEHLVCGGDDLRIDFVGTLRGDEAYHLFHDVDVGLLYGAL